MMVIVIDGDENDIASDSDRMVMLMNGGNDSGRDMMIMMIIMIKIVIVR